MKQFLLYLLYVGILFVLQMPLLLVRGLTDGSDFWKAGIGAFFEAIYFVLYMIPASAILMVALIGVVNPILDGLNVKPEPDDLEIVMWFSFAVVALAYSLLIGAVLWAITFVIRLIRDKTRSNQGGGLIRT